MRSGLSVVLLAAVLAGCYLPTSDRASNAGTFAAIPSMSRDDLCFVAQTVPDDMKPIAPCLFYENHSTQDVALVERSAGGNGFERLEACFKSGGTAALAAPWTLELGAAPTGQGTSIVGEPTARLSSEDFAGQGLVILHVVIPASGAPTFDRLSEQPSDYVGKLC
jgi:hypothetical protein